MSRACESQRCGEALVGEGQRVGTGEIARLQVGDAEAGRGDEVVNLAVEVAAATEAFP